MCDQGRLSYKYLNRDRVITAALRTDAKQPFVEATREEALSAAAQALKEATEGGVRSGLAVVASPIASNEDLLASLFFAKESLGISEIFVSGRPAGEADHYLMTADKNPNRKGLELVAAGLGLALKPFSELLEQLKAGKLHTVYAIGGEVPLTEAELGGLGERLAGLRRLVVQALNHTGLASFAHVLLPASTHVEDEGSFVNLEGRLQRFRRAYPANGESQPHWHWASDLLKALGHAAHFASSRDVFRQLKDRVAAFASFDWDKQAPFPRSPRAGRGIELQPTAADGRPPGYREFGLPRVRGI
jgi:NADH-quinone oxidoreductase subunit G